MLKSGRPPGIDYVSWAESHTQGGSQTRSKSPGNFCGDFVPYVMSGKGGRIKTVDGINLVDLLLGMGASVLGHGHPVIVDAVMTAVQDGTLYGLPHCLEAQVSADFVESVGHESVRWVKTGSEACTAAMRIARMATGRERIVTSDQSYHGWHDGFTSSKEDAPGIPKGLRGSVTTFAYNSLESLENQLKGSPSVAGILMEPALYEEPKNGFLEGVRALADKYGALLMFDEMLLGGRIRWGGGSELYEVRPDLACYGKAIGGGLPVAAVVGSWELMKHAWVVSGTFGGEALGLAAVRAMMGLWDVGSPAFRMLLWSVGLEIRVAIMKALLKAGLPVEIQGFPPLFRLKWNHPNAPQLATAFAWEMGRQGVLIHPQVIYASVAHTTEDINLVEKAAGRAAAKIQTGIEKGLTKDWPVAPCFKAVIRPQGG